MYLVGVRQHVFLNHQYDQYNSYHRNTVEYKPKSSYFTFPAMVRQAHHERVLSSLLFQTLFLTAMRSIYMPGVTIVSGLRLPSSTNSSTSTMVTLAAPAMTGPAPVGIKKAPIPALAARILSASVP